MDKKDELLIEEMRYIGQKYAQSGNEGFNVFYMYILVTTIIAAAVSPLVYAHFEAEKANDPIVPYAIDVLACVLLLAGFVSSWISLCSYFRAAKVQVDLVRQREEIKREYYPSYKEERVPDDLESTDCYHLVPFYIRLITELSGSLCLGGVVSIAIAALAFWRAIQPFILEQLVYQLITTVLAVLVGVVGGLLFSKPSWKSASKILRISFEEKPLVVTAVSGKIEPSASRSKDRRPASIWLNTSARRCIILCIVFAGILGVLTFVFTPYLHAFGRGSNFATNPQPASQIYVVAAFFGILVWEGCLLVFRVYITSKNLEEIEEMKKLVVKGEKSCTSGSAHQTSATSYGCTVHSNPLLKPQAQQNTSLPFVGILALGIIVGVSIAALPRWLKRSRKAHA